jgi:hypothetical protein
VLSFSNAKESPISVIFSVPLICPVSGLISVPGILGVGVPGGVGGVVDSSALIKIIKEIVVIINRLILKKIIFVFSYLSPNEYFSHYTISKTHD